MFSFFILLFSLASCTADSNLRVMEQGQLVAEEQHRFLQEGPDADPADVTDLFPYAPSGPVRLSALTGRWFMTYRSLFMGNNGYCTTVDYDIKAQTDLDNNKLRVTVAQRSNSPTGNLQMSIGSANNEAYGIDPIPGILYGMFTADLNKKGDSLNPGLFIVQGAGPIDIQTRQYAWVVMSDPAKSFSMVLARNVEDFRSLYQNAALDSMQANGFDKLWNQPSVEVPQGADCLYVNPTTFV